MQETVLSQAVGEERLNIQKRYSGYCEGTRTSTLKEEASMGLTHIEGTVTGPKGKRATLKFLVDSGATYTVLPYKVWRAIGLKPTDSVTCTLADGTEVTRKVSDCYITLPQGERQTPVILGKKDDEALLGVVTLEEFRLILNPFTRKLQPIRVMLA